MDGVQFFRWRHHYDLRYSTCFYFARSLLTIQLFSVAYMTILASVLSIFPWASQIWCCPKLQGVASDTSWIWKSKEESCIDHGLDFALSLVYSITNRLIIINSSSVAKHGFSDYWNYSLVRATRYFINEKYNYGTPVETLKPNQHPKRGELGCER